jgi:regulator of replication initiation timing|tara:strand:+ start:159 stop:575 length:417 start_codon:yes stop_codon:yes gene_type:complete
MEETLLKVINDVKDMRLNMEEMRNEIEYLRSENAKLIENEKDWTSVSTIVATKNENSRLMNENKLLRQSLEVRSKQDEDADDEELFTLKHKGSFFMLNGKNEVFAIQQKDCKGDHVGNRTYDQTKKKYKIQLFSSNAL